jgi:hypothetical protein
LERAQRGKHNEIKKNMQNGSAVWEKIEEEVSDPKMKSSNPSHD